ncbi:uncharacterized LOC729966 homolog isoform X2 [Anolis carolinensis]|uniref:uncharacterized LOC729966 homolog isoform X2 n=1 Tax=Anolis carolinensis TaxID=28377 RepID=UPI002F2B3A1B
MAPEPLWVLVAFAVAVTLQAESTPKPTSTQHVTLLNTTPTGLSVSSPMAPMTSSPTATTWSETSQSPKPPETTDDNGTTSHSTTGIETSTSFAGSTKPLTSQEAATTSGNTTATGDEDDSRLSEKPGLVAVICIFLTVLLIGAVVVVVKCFRAREPSFQKLDEVPMQGKAAEDSPFARYPPK